MQKIDLKRDLKYLYNPSSKKVEIIEVPPMNFLMIDGRGVPSASKEYKDALEALYSVSYTLKFMFKLGREKIDYPVMALEGLWWSDDMSNFNSENKNEWNWTSMIMQPDFINKEHIYEVIETVRKKKNPAALSKLRFERFDEGLSAQIMYIGAFSDEAPAIQRIHETIIESGHKIRGKHHEIYMSDFRRTAPEKLKTIIRQPME